MDETIKLDKPKVEPVKKVVKPLKEQSLTKKNWNIAAQEDERRRRWVLGLGSR